MTLRMQRDQEPDDACLLGHLRLRTFAGVQKCHHHGDPGDTDRWKAANQNEPDGPTELRSADDGERQVDGEDAGSGR